MTLADLLATLDGRLAPGAEGQLVLDGGPAAPPEALALQLRDWLYTTGYCQWQAPARAGFLSGDDGFVAALGKALGDHWSWEEGWQVAARGPLAHEPGAPWASVSNGRLAVFVTDGRDLDPPDAAPGAPVRLRLPAARPNRAPGFFYFVGPRGGSGRTGVLVRLYLDLAPAAAVTVLGALYEALAAALPRFEGKVANDPAAYGRVDPAVVYVAAGDYAAARAAVLDVHAAHPTAFRPATPLFARAIAPGVAVAESPTGEAGRPVESFGQHRCGLVARALVEALLAGEYGSAAWLARVDATFRAAGVPPEAPHVQTLAPDALA